MINIRSIQFRLILWYGSLVTVVFLALGAYIYRDMDRGLYRDLERRLAQRAGQIATDILPHAGNEPPDVIANQVRLAYSPETTDRFIRILRSDLSTFYLSGFPSGGAFDPANIVMPRLGETSTRIEPVAGGGMLIVTLPTEIRGEKFLVEIGQPTTEIEAVLHRLVRTLLAGLSLMIVAVSAGGYILVRGSLKPVEMLRSTAEQLTIGTVEQRLPVARTGDAIEQLGITLNQMLDRLHDAYRQASRFSADASHELRTPLTIIRAELESILHRDLVTREAMRDGIESVLEETERLSNITDMLFRLSRLDAGEGKMRDVAFDLAVMAANTIDQIRLLADEKKIALILETAEHVPVSGDPDRLKQVMIDLIDNALKYTPAGGEVTVRVFSADNKAVLEVSDTGIGISTLALPHVFERFYRADDARSRQIPGSGLGLSIVRSICQAHGGTVEIASVERQGTTCRVEMPLAG